MIASTERSALVCALVATLVGACPAALARPSAHAPVKPHTEKKQAEKPPEKPASQQERVDFTAAEAATAWPEGLPGRLRIAGDDVAAFQALIGGASAAGNPWLVLSGGGENGAFAAGLLAGWTQAGDRPAFGVVTGVSTGALIAPFAFVGPAADAVLKANYTEITAADVFELGGHPPAALTDNWPLKDRIDKSVTPDLLKAVAAEHAKGRRLLISTTQVDTERATVWDMGAIAGLAAGPEAGRYGDKALKLFREIVLASTAIPGVFPPVMIDALGEDGKRFQEMHGDGGAIAPFYLAPGPALVGHAAGFQLPTRTAYLVVNNRLTPEFGVAPRTILGVLGRSMSAAIKAQTRGAIAIAKTFAQHSGLDLHVAEIDGRFTKVSPAPFDPDYMKALYQHGENLGRAGTAFSTNQAQAREATPTTGAPARQPDGIGASAAR